MIHGDLYADNLLFGGEATKAILDFGESEYNLLRVDIVRTICSGIGIKDGRIVPEPTRSIIDGYESIRRLTVREREYLPMTVRYVCAAMAVWFQLHKMPQREEFLLDLSNFPQAIW